MTPGGKSLEGHFEAEDISLEDEEIFELGGAKKQPVPEAVKPPQIDEDILLRIRKTVDAVRVIRRSERDLKIKSGTEEVRLSISWFELNVKGAPHARVLDLERFMRNHSLAFKLIESAADTKGSVIATEPTEQLKHVWEYLCDQYAAVRDCVAPWGARVLPFVGSNFSEKALLNLEVMLNVRRWERLKEFLAFATAFSVQVQGPFEKFMSTPDNRFRYYASIVAALHLGLQ